MMESALFDLLRRSAAARREKALPVLTPEILADALISARDLYTLDPRKGALVQLQLLSEYARSHAELSLEALAPIDAIQEAILWAEQGKRHRLFKPAPSTGAPRVFNGNLLAACLAAGYLRKAGRTVGQACAEVAPHWGKTVKQMVDARRDFLSFKTGTEGMHKVYKERMSKEYTVHEAEKAARAAISRIESPRKVE